VFGRRHPRIHERAKPHRTLYLPAKDGARYPDPDLCHCEVWSRDGYSGSQCGRKFTSTEVHKVKVKKGPGRPRLIKIPVCKINSREYMIAKEEARDSKWKRDWARSRAGWDVDSAGRGLLSILVRLTPSQVASLPPEVQEAREKYTDAMEAQEGLRDEHDQEAQDGDAMAKLKEATG